MPSLNQGSSRAVKTRLTQPAIDSFNDGDGESNKEQDQIESSSSLSNASPNYMKPTSCSYAKKGSASSQQPSSANSESSFDVSESDSWKPNAVSFVKPVADSSSRSTLSLKSNHRQVRKKSSSISPFPNFVDYVMPDEEGNESDRSTSSCSSSENRELKGKIQLKKTLKKSRSSRRGSFRSSFRSPNYLKATSSSSQKKMQIQASLVDYELSSFDHEKTISNLKSSKPKLGASGYKSKPKNLLRRSSSIRTVRILINKSSFKPKSDLGKKFSQFPHDLTAIRPTCSSTLKSSKFPQHVDLHSGENESERKTVVKICPYNYCSLHGHQHNPPLPPLKRLLSKRRRLLKTQRTMNLRSKSSLRGINLDDVVKELGMNQVVVDGDSEIQEKGKARVEMYPVGEEEGSDIFVQIYTKPKRVLSRRSSEGNEDAKLDDVLFGESSYPETALQDHLNQERNFILGDKYVPEDMSVHEQLQMDCCDIDTSSSLPSPRPGNSPITCSDDIPSTYLGLNYVESADRSCKSSIADCISKATEENTKEEIGAEGVENDGDLATNGAIREESVSSVDSEANTGATEEYRPQHQKKNRISMWHLIHQNMVSGLSDGAQAERLPNGDKQKHIDSTSSSLASTPRNEEDNQEIQLQKMYAIKMVREAIEKILLPEVQDQVSDDQSISSNASSEQQSFDMNNGEVDEQSTTDITIDEVSGVASEETAPKDEKRTEKRSLKNWSNLKKLILLKRFIKALEKVRTFKLREPHHLPLKPGPEAEKVSLRRGVLDSKKSSEAWMLDYALQQVVSELAPVQKRKVALLVKAFETVVSPSGEPLTQVIFRKSKVTREGSCREHKPEGGASEITSSDTNVEKIETSGLDNGEDLMMSVKPSNVHADSEENGVYEEVPRVNSECCEEDNNESDTQNVVVYNLSDAAEEPLNISERAPSNDLVQASINNTAISSVCASSLLEEHTATAEQKKEDSTLSSDTVVEFGPVRDSGPNNNNQEAQKSMFKKEKHASMWHMIHRQMVAGLSEESNNLLEKETDEHVDDVNTLVAAESSSSSPNSSDLAQNVERRYDDNEGQEVELRKIYAVKLVREAIERILLPELDDQPSDDQQSTGKVMTDEDLMKKDLDTGGKPRTLTLHSGAEDSFRECDSIKVRDSAGLSQEEPKLEIAHMPEAASQDEPSDVLNKSEKETPKGWSNLKKMILLKRFIKELEKVKKFNPRKPRFLPLLPDEEAERVRLRSQMMDERKNAEEWMLDYALRKVISELAPMQKRKVELFVKAFETVAPPSEEPQVQEAFRKFKGISGEPCWSGREQDKFISKDAEEGKASKDPLRLNAEIGESCSTISSKNSSVSVHGKSEEDATSGLHEKLLSNGSESNAKHGKLDPLKIADPSHVTKNEMEYGRGDLRASRTPIKEKTGDSATDCTTEVPDPTQLDKHKHIKMWHLLCQHVVSSIDAKVETEFLDGDDEYDQVESPSTTLQLKSGSTDGISRADHERNKEEDLSSQNIRFSRRSAVQLVRDAIEEILQPEIQDDSSDAQSNASDIIMEQELEEKNHRVFGALNISKPSSVEDSFGTGIESHNPAEQRSVSTEGSKFSLQKSGNWNKLKKVILLKRTIKALEKARKSNPSVPRSLPLAPDLKEEKVDLKHQSAAERKKAEEWMLDHALQHAVNKLTPARKRRVSMLVEAFEAVVPLPQV